MRLSLAAIALAIAFAAPAYAQKFAGNPTAQEIGYIELHMGRIKDRLKDPDSAQFSGMYVSRKVGSPIVCGYVNSKNGFGGYTGKQPFISGGTMQITPDDMAKGEFPKSWAQIC